MSSKVGVKFVFLNKPQLFCKYLTQHYATVKECWLHAKGRTNINEIWKWRKWNMWKLFLIWLKFKYVTFNFLRVSLSEATHIFLMKEDAWNWQSGKHLDTTIVWCMDFFTSVNTLMLLNFILASGTRS